MVDFNQPVQEVVLLIQTKRCQLRPFNESDLDSFMEYRNNEDWMKYQTFKNLTKADFRKALMLASSIDVGLQLAIVDKTTDKLLGDVYLKKEATIIEIGFTINPKYSRKGYITEVMSQLLNVLEKEYYECTITAQTEQANLASQNLLIKLGFIKDTQGEDQEIEYYLYVSKTS